MQRVNDNIQVKIKIIFDDTLSSKFFNLISRSFTLLLPVGLYLYLSLPPSLPPFYSPFFISFTLLIFNFLLS